MAMESPVLLSALVAFSSANWSYFNSDSEVVLLNGESRALYLLSASIVRNDIADQQSNLASCLVLSATDIQLGRQTGWNSHLQDARSITDPFQAMDRGGGLLVGPKALQTSAE